MGKGFRPFDEIVKLRKALAPKSHLFVGFDDQAGGKDCFLRVLRMVGETENDFLSPKLEQIEFKYND
jgi:hypothetical protein